MYQYPLIFDKIKGQLLKGNIMLDLMKVINISVGEKPEFGAECNHCGWCCLTEVCPTGQAITGTSVIPCSLLKSKGGKHYCSLIEGADMQENKELIGAGVGCCAETQEERIIKLSRASL